MPSVIPRDFIDTLLNRVDIVDVIDRHVKLKKAGTNFQACCPFHSEKSPSFTVSPTKQFYHCFGCGAHGSAIGFLMEYAGMGFIDAVKELAQQVGMQVPDERPNPEQAARKQEAPSLLETMRKAFDFYRAELKKAPQAIAYLKGRGVTGEIAAKFGLGYSPEGWQALEAVFGDYAASRAIKDCGLVIDSEPEGEKPSRRYDRFRDRVMFPILDTRGSVIGFGGRVMGKGEPKYLNSPETPLFEKGRELYGLYQGRRSIRDSGEVIVVEGYMDVIALVQHGVENAVATLGTATTPMHLEKLFRLADTVVFCFDGDSAGRKAAWRALEVALPVLSDAKLVKFLFLPAEDDPDTYVRREGTEGFRAAMQTAKTLSEFLVAELKSQVDLTTGEGRARLTAIAKPMVAKIAAPALAMMVERELAAASGLSRDEFSQLMPQRASAPSQRNSAPPRSPRRAPKLEERLLVWLIAQPALSRELESLQPIERLPGLETVAALVSYLKDCDGEATPAQVLETFRETEHESALHKAMSVDWHFAESLNADETRAELVDAAASLARKLRDMRLAELAAIASKSTLTGDEQSEYRALISRETGATSG